MANNIVEYISGAFTTIDTPYWNEYHEGGSSISHNLAAYPYGIDHVDDTTISPYYLKRTTTDSNKDNYICMYFDVSQIPFNTEIKSMEVKFRCSNCAYTNAWLAEINPNATYSSSLVTDLSRHVSVSNVGTESEVFSLVPDRIGSTNKTYSEILEHISENQNYRKFALVFSMFSEGNSKVNLWGAQLEVTYPNNKVIYGEEILIDLTSDTATKADVLNGKTFHLANGIAAAGTCLYNCDTSSDTATEADVASGKTFHLANGSIGIGSFSPSVSKATATTSSSTARTVSFTVNKEPSWFVLVCSSRSTPRTPNVYSIVYNGINTYTRYSGANNGSVSSSTSYGSFSYSRGTLTITVSSACNFSAANWELYYL